VNIALAKLPSEFACSTIAWPTPLPQDPVKQLSNFTEFTSDLVGNLHRMGTASSVLSEFILKFTNECLVVDFVRRGSRNAAQKHKLIRVHVIREVLVAKRLQLDD